MKQYKPPKYKKNRHLASGAMVANSSSQQYNRTPIMDMIGNTASSAQQYNFYPGDEYGNASLSGGAGTKPSRGIAENQSSNTPQQYVVANMNGKRFLQQQNSSSSSSSAGGKHVTPQQMEYNYHNRMDQNGTEAHEQQQQPTPLFRKRFKKYRNAMTFSDAISMTHRQAAAAAASKKAHSARRPKRHHSLPFQQIEQERRAIVNELSSFDFTPHTEVKSRGSQTKKDTQVEKLQRQVLELQKRIKTLEFEKEEQKKTLRVIEELFSEPQSVRTELQKWKASLGEGPSLPKTETTDAPSSSSPTDATAATGDSNASTKNNSSSTHLSNNSNTNGTNTSRRKAKANTSSSSIAGSTTITTKNTSSTNTSSKQKESSHLHANSNTLHASEHSPSTSPRRSLDLSEANAIAKEKKLVVSKMQSPSSSKSRKSRAPIRRYKSEAETEEQSTGKTSGSVDDASGRETPLEKEEPPLVPDLDNTLQQSKKPSKNESTEPSLDKQGASKSQQQPTNVLRDSTDKTKDQTKDVVQLNIPAAATTKTVQFHDTQGSTRTNKEAAVPVPPSAASFSALSAQRTAEKKKNRLLELPDINDFRFEDDFVDISPAI